MEVLSDSCGGSYHCGDRSEKKKLAPLGGKPEMGGSPATYVAFVPQLIKREGAWTQLYDVMYHTRFSTLPSFAVSATKNKRPLTRK